VGILFSRRVFRGHGNEYMGGTEVVDDQWLVRGTICLEFDSNSQYLGLNTECVTSLFTRIFAVL
jgi:hypothetical protein